MDTQTAAQLLSVAEHEVIDVRQDETGWYALHHDMASHEETWRGPLHPVTHAGWWESGVPAAAQTLPDEMRLIEDGGHHGTEGLTVLRGAADGAKTDEVPEGNAKQVLEWVDADASWASQRAGRALEVERAKEKPRATLVAELEKRAD